MSHNSPRMLAGCLVAIFLVSTLLYFGPQTVEYVRMRPMLLRAPDDPPRGWSSAPQPLEEFEVSKASRFVISRDGYQFEVPWGELKSERGDGEIELQTGYRIRYGQPQLDPINPAILHCNLSDFTKIFGTPLHESRYDQFRDIVSAVPSGWSPLQSHRGFRRYEKLLEIKGLWFEHNPTAPDVLSFQTTDYQGFELSGLRRGWQNVTLYFFDSQNHWFVINIQGDELRGMKLTQPEINLVIQSFGFVHSGTSRSVPD